MVKGAVECATHASLDAVGSAWHSWRSQSVQIGEDLNLIFRTPPQEKNWGIIDGGVIDCAAEAYLPRVAKLSVANIVK